MEIIRIVAPVLEANCYVIVPELSTKALIVDPGAGASQAVTSVLEQGQWTVGAVLLTHGHPDHVWDAAAVAHDAPVYIAQADHYRLEDPVGHTLATRLLFTGQWNRPTNVQILPPALYAAGGAQLIEGCVLQALSTPGHTEGSTVFFGHSQVQTHGQDLGFNGHNSQAWMLSGDVIFKGSVGRSDLQGSSPQSMEETLRMLKVTVAPETVLLPGHGPATTMSQELITNQFLNSVR
ncbi:MAG: MBL fold metallo-hydrolase [Actinomycetaceae bacterium]|nr:MBL fold metallo-hydrolase [Actinomycetaceae bacterium]